MASGARELVASDCLWASRCEIVGYRAQVSVRPSDRGARLSAVSKVEKRLAHSSFTGYFGERRQMHTVIGPQPIPFGKLTCLTTHR